MQNIRGACHNKSEQVVIFYMRRIIDEFGCVLDMDIKSYRRGIGRSNSLGKKALSTALLQIYMNGG